MEDGRVAGLFARHGQGRDARLTLFRAPAVIFATGGLGSLYAVTTNPPESRGEGVGMAARAGAVIADAEFVQFHPTAIAIGRDPAPLATEALRGEGAALIDETGRRFMPAIHADAELAPRDIVARALHREIARGPLRISGLPRRPSARRSSSAFRPSMRPAGKAASIRRRCRSRSRRPRTTTWAASPPMRTAARRWTACGPSANAPRRACTAPTGLPPIRCSKRWSSAARAADDIRGTEVARAGTRQPPAPQPLRGRTAAACAARCDDETCRSRTRPRRTCSPRSPSSKGSNAPARPSRRCST